MLPISKKIASFGGIAALLVPLSMLSACSSTGPAPVTMASAGTAVAAPAQPTQKILLEGVQFKSDEVTIRHSSDPVLDSAVEMLKSHPDMKVYVDTYCDPSGGKKLNMRLSQERGVNMIAYLHSQGIASDRMVSRAFGATDFVASNVTTDGRQQNHRVELVPFTTVN